MTVDTTPSTQVIAGRYELGSRLGAGGMAEVFSATDRVLDRRVAVKVLVPPFASDPSFVARFEREARASAGLNHPHVVAVYDAGVADGTAFLVMEYLPGLTLRELLKQRGALPEGEAVGLAAQVADGLTAAHRAGLVHCDIKPANVLLDADGRAKVADFGIARAASMEPTTDTTSVLGTVHYLSPEQAQRQPIDARSDVYSLGALLYELLTGSVPFAGNSPVAVAIQHVQAPPPSPRAVRPEISRATEAVVLRALAKRPDERFQSAADMFAAVTGVQTQDATMPLPTTPLPRSAGASPHFWAGRRARRPWATLLPRGQVVPLLALAVFILVVGAAIALARSTGSTDRASQSTATELTAPPARVTVPDLSGVSQQRATSLLVAAGLRLGSVDQEESSGAPVGQVIDQDPAPDESVPGDSVVSIVVSSGPPASSTAPLAPAGAPTGPPGQTKSGKGHGRH